MNLYWHSGNWSSSEPFVMALDDHSYWLGSTVFDGARRFRGKTPDLEAHCHRLVRSAHALGMNPKQAPEDIVRLCMQGMELLDHGGDIYIRPAMHLRGSQNIIGFDPSSVELTVSLVGSDTPYMKPFTACFVPYRRPDADMAINDAKSASLYPHSLRAIGYAKRAGFDNAILCDSSGNVAEFASANIFIVSEGLVKTPRLSGSFLAGITRERVISLLKPDLDVLEVDISTDDVLSADEIFLTGNFSQIQPCVAVDGVRLGDNPLTRRISDAYGQWIEALPNVGTAVQIA